jgi:anti-sigma factor RsiW
MNCEDVQEIILTDYIDGCLTGSIKTQLESHIKDCPECQEFRAVALKILSVPFADLPRERMPESVVKAVMANVTAKQTAYEGMWLQQFLEGIRKFDFPTIFVARLAVFVFTLFVMSGIGLRINNLQQAKQKERVLFLASIVELPSINNKVVGTYGTSMESYFL